MLAVHFQNNLLYKFISKDMYLEIGNNMTATPNEEQGYKPLHDCDPPKYHFNGMSLPIEFSSR